MEIPDIDFSVDCPICNGPLEYDGGAFDCGRCFVLWPRNGEGREAEVHRKDEGMCEARHPGGPSAWHWEGEFCAREADHRGGHEIDRDGRVLARWATPAPAAVRES